MPILVKGVEFRTETIANARRGRLPLAHTGVNGLKRESFALNIDRV